MRGLVLALGTLVATSVGAFAQDMSAITDEMNQMMEAREIAQTIAVADACGLALDSNRVGELAETISGWSSPTARMTFQTSGRAHQRRVQSMTDIEKASACGLARGTARKHGLID